MLKNLVQIEHKIGNNIYHFICDPASPLNEVKDALFQFLKYVGQVEDTVKAQQAAQAPAEPAPEASKVEEIKPEA